MDMTDWLTTAVPILTAVGLKIVGAIVLYMIARWLIGIAISMMQRVLTARNFDPTLQRYIANIPGGRPEHHSRRCHPWLFRR